MTRPPLIDINAIAGMVGLGPIPSQAPVAAFNPDQIESLLITKGINAIHYKHAPDPNRETVTGPVNPNTNAAAWGARFFTSRKLKAVPQNFALENRLNVQGIWGLHTVLLNISGYYFDDKKETAYCRPGDLIVLDTDADGNGITAEVDQLTEYNPTGPLKLNFRVEGVTYLADKERVYIEAQDFFIVNGKIQWHDKGAKPNFKDGKGAVLSVVYYTKPIYIVKNVPHSLRILPGNSTGNGALPREARYAPQLVVAQQSWIRSDNTELLDFSGLPSYPEYRNTKNVTGGAY